MNLIEAYLKGFPLVAEIAPDNHRLMVAIWEHPYTGIMFADVGWPGASWHPFHHLPGPITGSGPWRIGGVIVRFAAEGEPIYREWENWQAWRRTDEGKLYTPSAAQKEAKRQGLF